MNQSRMFMKIFVAEFTDKRNRAMMMSLNFRFHGPILALHHGIQPVSRSLQVGAIHTLMEMVSMSRLLHQPLLK